MTVICNYCNRPIKTGDIDSVASGSYTKDYHREAKCQEKETEEYWAKRLAPAAQPMPAPAPIIPVHVEPVRVAPIPAPAPQRRSFWGGKPKAKTEDELAGAFG